MERTAFSLLSGGNRIRTIRKPLIGGQSRDFRMCPEVFAQNRRDAGTTGCFISMQIIENKPIQTSEMLVAHTRIDSDRIFGPPVRVPFVRTGFPFPLDRDFLIE